MNNHLIALFSLITSSSLFIVGCGDTSTFETPANTVTLTNEIQTEIPDQNSLTLAFEKLAVEAINLVGVTNNVTAYVADRHNNPVPDDTAIKFLTNGGKIQPQCLTVGGECTVIWNDQDPTPASLKAIVIAYTTGEESFTDLNDNDLYDAGEPFTDISEPFFDLNEDMVRDDTAEEFIDADSDNVFDKPDGLFTGTPCTGDNTVCDRVSTQIWRSNSIQLSGSFGVASLSGSLPTLTNTTSFYTVTVVDLNGNPLADGTSVTLSSDDGTVTPSSFNLAPLATDFTIQYKSGNTTGKIETLTIDVTSPSGAIKLNLISSPSALVCDKCEIGGTITGATNPVQLQLNGIEITTVSESGTFKFATKVPQGDTYTVTVFNDGAIVCTPSNASGTVFDNVTDVSISCI